MSGTDILLPGDKEYCKPAKAGFVDISAVQTDMTEQ
jgi:hypothetical protein